MKRAVSCAKRLYVLRALLAAGIALSAGPAGAATQYTSGTITWDNGTTAAWGASSGGPYSSVWTSGNDAVLEGPAGTVTISSATAHNLTFTASGYTLQSSTLTLNAATPTISMGAGMTNLISSVIAGSAGLAKSGLGGLKLSGANTFSGNVTINGGMVFVSTDGTGAANPLGAYPGSPTANNITIAGGGGIGPLVPGYGVAAPALTLAANRGIVLDTGLQFILRGWRANLAVNGVISGSGGIIVGETAGYGDGSTGGGGNTAFGGVNTFTGDTILFDLGTQDPPFNPGASGLQNSTFDYNSTLIPNNATFNKNNNTPVLGGLKGNKNLIIAYQSAGFISIGNNNQNTIFLGILSNGSGLSGITKIGTGTLQLGGVNTFTGGATVNNGTLVETATGTSLGTQAVSGNNGLTVANGATFAFLPTVAGPLTLGQGKLTLATGSTIGTAVGGTAGQSAITSTVAASTTGTMTLNVSGIPGVTVTAGANNLITAASGLNGGTINLGKIYNATTFTVTSGLTVAAGSVSINVATAAALTGAYWKGGFAGGNNVWALSDGSAAGNWTTDSGGTTGTGLVPGPAADVTISATGASNQGAMVLGANMKIKSLTVIDTSAVTLNADGYQLTLAPAASTNGLIVTSGSGAVTVNSFLALGAAQTWANNSANTLTIGGDISNGANALTLDGTGNTLISGQFRYGTGGLTKNGNGTLTLAGTNTSFKGTTTVNAGTVVAGNPYAFGFAIADIGGFTYGWGYANVAFGASSTGLIQLNGNNIILSSLSTGSPVGTPVVENGSGTDITLTVTESTSTATAATHTYAGVLQDGSGGGSLSLMAPTVGTLILSGANTYTGSTLIRGGTLQIGNGGTTGSLSTNSKIVDNATLKFNRSDAVVQGVHFYSGGISGSGNLIQAGSGVLVLNVPNSYAGTTTVSAGTLAATGNQAASSGFIVNSAAALSPGTTNTAGGTLTVSALQLDSGSGVVVEFNASPTNDRIVVANSGGLTINGGAVTLLDEAGAAWTTDGTYNLIQYSGALGGLGLPGLSVANPQAGKSYFFTASNNWICITLVTAPTATWDGGSVADSGWKTAQNWNPDTAPVDGSALIFATGNRLANTNDFDANTRISGITFNNTSGAFVLSGSAVNLVGNVTNNDADLQTINLDLVLDGGSRAISANSGSIAINGAIGEANGAWGLYKTGAQTLTLSGNNSYSGLTTVNAGTLTLAGDNTTTGGLTLNAATLNINTNGALGSSGTLTLNNASAVLNNTSAGLVTVANNNPQSWAANFAYTGTGNNELNLGAGAVTLTANRTVTVNGGTLTVGGAIGDGGGAYTLTKAGAGTLTLSGNNTYSGTTTISAGTLKYGANDVISAGGVTLNNATSVLDMDTYNDTIGTLTMSAGSITGSGGTLTCTAFAPSGTIAISANFTDTGNLGNTFINGPTLTLSGTSSFTGSGSCAMKGRIIVSGGTTTFTLTGAGYTQFGYQSTAYVDVTGGTLNVNSAGGNIGFGGNNNNAHGLLRQSAGIVSFTGAAARLGLGASDTGTLLFSGGTATLASVSTGGTGLCVVEGGTVSVTGAFGGNIKGVSVISGSLSVGSYSTSGTVSGTLLSGGSLTVNSGNGTLTDSYGVFLSGGTLSVNAISTPTLCLSGGVTIKSGNSAGNLISNAAGAKIYTGGVIIDTTGGDATISTPLAGTTGSGLTGIGVNNHGSGYVDSLPTITLTGGTGTAATTFPNFNTDGTITNISIGSPGAYTVVPTGATVGAGGATLYAPTSGDNTLGGLTKIGTGTLTLSATNTFTGSTTISVGVLTLTGAGVLAASTNIVVEAGATLCLATNDCISTNAAVRLNGTYGKMILSNGVAQAVSVLWINGAAKLNGTWGSTASPAANKNDDCFSGPGMLVIGSLLNDDMDGDGIGNELEEICGTDPNDAASVMKISAMVPTNGADIRLEFVAGSNRTVRILAANRAGVAKTVVGVVTNSAEVWKATNWTDFGAVNVSTQRFYQLAVASNGVPVWTNTEEWAMYVQPRAAGTWYMAGTPVDFETPGENNLTNTLGAQLMRGLQQGGEGSADLVWVLKGEQFVKHWVMTNVWYALSGTAKPTNTVISSGTGFWVRRVGNFFTNTVFTGKTRTNGTYVVNITTNWNFLTWPFKTERAEAAGAGTADAGWGFLGCGALGGKSATNADVIIVLKDNAWRRYRLLDGYGGPVDGRWWDDTRGGYADFTMEAGQGFYYYRRGTTGFVWTNSYGP